MSTGSRKSPPRVLVVDDDPVIRKLTRAALAKDGLQTDEAADGIEALRQAFASPPDLVLLDVKMPGKDGFAVCKELRASAKTADVPVLVMTGSEDHDSIARAYEAGATDFALKPPNWTILRHRVRYMIRSGDQYLELMRRERQLAAAQRLARLGSFELDTRSGTLGCSDELLRIFGVPLEVEPDPRELAARVHADDRDRLERSLQDAFGAAAPSTVEYRLRLPDGAQRYVEMDLQTARDERGEVTKVEGTVQDITARKEAEEEVRFLAYHDSLTGLANRRLLPDVVRAAVEGASTRDTQVALLCIDLDDFKQVNDSFGHLVGDQVLREVAHRIVESVRGLDHIARGWRESMEDPVARLGGDEFAVVLPAMQRPEDAAAVAARLLHRLDKPIRVEGQDLRVSASIGIALYPQDARAADELLRDADAALYQAKRTGKGRYTFFDAEMNRSVRRRYAIQSRLRVALDESRLRLFYQPKVETSTFRVTGVEALMRWDDPELGEVGPAEFIPIAEQTALMDALAEWSFRTACAQARSWIDVGLDFGRVAMNVSPRRLQDRGLVRMLDKLLAEYDLDPRFLEIEITENMLLRSSSETALQLQALRERGIRVAIDDFGTGYSSLRYLHELAVDTLKIDRSFVAELGGGPDADALVDAIVSVARALDLGLVAEGVETEAQRARLEARGCDQIQGYLISPPLPADRIERELRLRSAEWRPEPARESARRH